MQWLAREKLSAIICPQIVEVEMMWRLLQSKPS